jgi:hypothetical protein
LWQRLLWMTLPPWAIIRTSGLFPGNVQRVVCHRTQSKFAFGARIRYSKGTVYNKFAEYALFGRSRAEATTPATRPSLFHNLI